MTCVTGPWKWIHAVHCKLLSTALYLFWSFNSTSSHWLSTKWHQLLCMLVLAGLLKITLIACRAQKLGQKRTAQHKDKLRSNSQWVQSSSETKHSTWHSLYKWCTAMHHHDVKASCLDPGVGSSRDPHLTWLLGQSCCQDFTQNWRRQMPETAMKPTPAFCSHASFYALWSKLDDNLRKTHVWDLQMQTPAQKSLQHDTAWCWSGCMVGQQAR